MRLKRAENASRSPLFSSQISVRYRLIFAFFSLPVFGRSDAEMRAEQANIVGKIRKARFHARFGHVAPVAEQNSRIRQPPVFEVCFRRCVEILSEQSPKLSRAERIFFGKIG